MNFLQLCQKVSKKCGLSGSITDTASAVGESLRVVEWVNEAWQDIQLSQTNWDWMRYEFTFDTVAGVQSYSPVSAGLTSFSRWHTDTFRCYKTALGLANDKFITELDYPSFRDTYMLGIRIPAEPSTFAIKPRGSLILLGETPDDVYTIYGEYQKSVSELVSNTDEPDMPAEYHMAIVHAARIKYAAYENAAEVMEEASRDFSRLMGNLAMTQIDGISTGSPLA